MIETRGLSMKYGQIKAVNGVTFSVNKGEVVGLLGPNGAGKTTIMKILSTQIVPTGGMATVNGHYVLNAPLSVRESLGYLPEQAPLYDQMEVREYLSFVARGRHLEGEKLKKRLRWVAEACGIEKMWCRPLRQLSKGYRQRVGIAQALLHDPPVLILDEPTSGLDPLQIMEIRRLVRELASEKAILFSTHILQEIKAVSDRIVVINDGKVMAQGTIDELTDNFIKDSSFFLSVSCSDDVEPQLKNIEGVKSIKKISARDNVQKFELWASKDTRLGEAIRKVANEKNWTVLEFYKREPDLEEVFISVIKQGRGQ